MRPGGPLSRGAAAPRIRRLYDLARIALAVAALLAPAAANAAAPESPVATAETPRVVATLAPELAVAAPGDTVAIVLHQRIIPGWHTYWENPGDSGQRTDIRWTLPDGVSAGALRFPVPEPIPFGPLMNHGFSGEAAMLTELSVPASWPPGRPLEVQALATWLVCAEVCIPEEGRFTLSLPTAAQPVVLEPVRELFASARAALPRAAPAEGWTVSARDHGDSVVLSVSGPAAQRLGGEALHFFPRTWGHLEHAAPQRRNAGGDGRIELVLTKGETGPGGTLAGVLALADGSAGFDVVVPVLAAGASAGEGAVVVAAAAPVTDAAGAPPGVLTLLLLALAGGVLLNLMPCVFPVLAMKAMALVSHAGEPARARAAGGLAYAGGVLAAFAALAVTLIALKTGGEAVGWGFHLQSPAVVAGLSLVLFAVGLNLSGLLEVGGAWTGVGSGLAARPGARGSFFTGVLAAVVATPCTAPFMATAIGVALLQSAPVALAVFLALGAGLAAPYLVLTLLPGLGRRLPRPGPWMERLKQLLAFPMYLSAAWLVWVLAQQSGADAVGLVLLAMVGLALAAWCAGAARASAGAGRRAAGVLGGLAAAGALAAVAAAGLQPPPAQRPSDTAGEVAERYDPQRLDAILDAGGAVFVNVTAAWCVTCKVNERVALSGDGFLRALEATGVVYMKGDWTRRDPQLTALLERFGRAGVPLYVVFPRGGDPPWLLPQVLTESIVSDALSRA